MAFWGVEIKAGKPFVHTYDDELGRLHISQATLGIGGTKQRSVVECTVGDKAPILLCALLPGKNETSPLDLEFEEEDKVILSVHGPRSVHLTGYYLGSNECGHDDYNDDESDSMDGISGEDTDSEEFDYDSDNDDYLEDDGEDLDMFPSGKSAVVIEEIEDDEKPTENGNANSKHPKKSDGADNQKQIVVKDNALESEDEDGFPITSTNKNKEVKSEKNVTKDGKKVEDGSVQGASTKRKNESINQDSNAEKLSEEAKDSFVIGQESDNKSKKKRKKGKKGVAEDEEKSDKMVEDRVEDKPKEEQPNDKNVDNADQDDGQVKKKKNKKKNKAQESDASASKEVAEKKAPTVVTEAKKEKKRSQVRTFDNGMVIEELELGKAVAKKADNGSKVSMRYIGKLKSNGKIFDSNIRGPPFQFRLGVGQVIKGWDVGVKGMRVGDKRRLTLPPSMGYGAKGAPPQIPQNAWLVFDVELVDVRK